jgi:hypothetical protein
MCTNGIPKANGRIATQEKGKRTESSGKLMFVFPVKGVLQSVFARKIRNFAWELTDCETAGDL